MGFLALLFLVNLRALLPRLRESNGDRLLPACHPPSLASLPRAQRSALFPVHRALHRFSRRFSIPGHDSPFTWRVSRWFVELTAAPDTERCVDARKISTE